MKKHTLIFLLPLLLVGMIACNKPVDPGLSSIFTGSLLTKEVEIAPYAEFLRLFKYNQAGQVISQYQEPTKNGGVPGYERVFTYDRPGGKLTKIEQWGLFLYPTDRRFSLKTTYEYNLDQTIKLTIDSIPLNKLIENKRVSFSYDGGRLTSQLIYTHEYAGGGFAYSAPIPTYMIKRAISYNGQNQVIAEVDSVWGLTSVENNDYNPIRPITPKLRGVYKNSYTYNAQGDIESEVKYFPAFYSDGALTTYTYSYNSKGLPIQIDKTVRPVNSTLQTTIISRTYSD